LIVAESVVVIKKLLQTQQGSHGEIVGQMARLVCRITVPPARAAILWYVYGPFYTLNLFISLVYENPFACCVIN